MKRASFLVLIIMGAAAPILLGGGPVVGGIYPPYGTTTPGQRVLILGKSFSPDAKVFFDGLEARQTVFVDTERVEAITPYLRPGEHRIQARCAGTTARSNIIFTALPTPVDSEIDSALALAQQGETAQALKLLGGIASTHVDYQVRAFAHYQRGQLYLELGELRRWEIEASLIYEHSDLAGKAIQTYWPYRLAFAHTDYLFDVDTRPEIQSKVYDTVVGLDVTDDPEPRFFHALVNARVGNLLMAREESAFCVRAEPANPAYVALAAFVAACSDDRAGAAGLSTEARSLLRRRDQPDARTLSLLGETAYLLGEIVQARQDWAEAGRIYPVGCGLALQAAKKHLWLGTQRIAMMLLSETAAMLPGSAEAQEAGELIAGIPPFPQ